MGEVLSAREAFVPHGLSGSLVMTYDLPVATPFAFADAVCPGARIRFVMNLGVSGPAPMPQPARFFDSCRDQGSPRTEEQ